MIDRLMTHLKRPILLRRVVGPSMAPKLYPGQLVVATTLFRRLRPGEVVIFRKHSKEMIKRIEEVDQDKVFVIGDNLAASTDSRQFGWLSRKDIIARVVHPSLSK